MLYDLYTKWISAVGVPDKSADSAFAVMNDFCNSSLDEKVDYFYSDNSGELENAAAALKWPHGTSTPGMPQTNGMAERMIRKIKKGRCSYHPMRCRFNRRLLAVCR